MNRTLWTLVTLSIFLAAPVIAQDLVQLANGARLDGTILRETEATITLRIGAGTVDIQKSQIKKIERRPADEKKAEARALVTLSRFADRETWHFLYRKGRRVGYRTIKLSRDLRDGIPGYLLEDRLAFVSDPAIGPEVELTVNEFVDAELRPLEVVCRRRSGTSGWELRGTRDGETLDIVERWAGNIRKRSALLRSDVALWGMHLRRMAVEPVPDGGYQPVTLFNPSLATFRRVELKRRIDRVTLKGRAIDVLVFRRIVGSESLETWVDMAGEIVREEITSPYLVSLRSTRKEVAAYLAGEAGQMDGDLGLEFVSVESGLRLIRPDAAWEMDLPVEEGSRLVSFLRPGLRATVDVFRVDRIPPGSTAAGVALDLFGRMQANCKDVTIEGPFSGTVGDLPGLRFKMKSRRRKEELTTLGAVIVDRGQGFIFLCAAPTVRYQEVVPVFKEVLDSVRVVLPESEPEVILDPFDEMPTVQKPKAPPPGDG